MEFADFFLPEQMVVSSSPASVFIMDLIGFKQTHQKVPDNLSMDATYETLGIPDQLAQGWMKITVVCSRKTIRILDRAQRLGPFILQQLAIVRLITKGPIALFGPMGQGSICWHIYLGSSNIIEVRFIIKQLAQVCVTPLSSINCSLFP